MRHPRNKSYPKKIRGYTVLRELFGELISHNKTAAVTESPPPFGFNLRKSDVGDQPTISSSLKK
ncbi:hypothetical protein [Aurantiacibacter rhizosphaerae]|uniref:Uncharacterized protein n=1 Tax=Aurantiacibacter rhizosphaerae TaxID=2691582 RepID=A0A844XD13_9SPHN|nr:hypothetical protein [Aurantiacibacter rhizosphaerae]MWV27653.1 hypothetical protein [Aurantiacibacter rhizosphaerae]